MATDGSSRRYFSRERADVDIRAPRQHVNVTVVYSCGCQARLGHHQQFANRIREDAMCQRHGKTVQVVSVSPTYCIRCEDCRHRRYYGNDELTAKVYAAKHSINNRHRVTILKGNEIVHVVGNTDDQLTLDTDEPPF